MPFSNATEEMQKLVAGVFGACIAAILTWYRMRRITASDNKQAQTDDATTGVITMLRAEIARLADQNTKLALLVHDLQFQVIRVQRDNANLREDLNRIKNVG